MQPPRCYTLRPVDPSELPPDPPADAGDAAHWHRAVARNLLKWVGDLSIEPDGHGDPRIPAVLASAQVHATLAVSCELNVGHLG